jgi:4'-phosphopantetheinyl transferase EntD
VVALRRHVAALGLDSEVVGDVNEEIWPSICTSKEIEWLQSLPDAARGAALIFSTKEAFYKCQYSVTQEFLGFKDVRVEIPEWNGTQGEFLVHPMRPIGIEAHAPSSLRGRYLFHEGFVTAGMGLGDAAPSQ